MKLLNPMRNCSTTDSWPNNGFAPDTASPRPEAPESNGRLGSESGGCTDPQTLVMNEGPSGGRSLPLQELMIIALPRADSIMSMMCLAQSFFRGHRVINHPGCKICRLAGKLRLTF